MSKNKSLIISFIFAALTVLNIFNGNFIRMIIFGFFALVFYRHYLGKKKTEEENANNKNGKKDAKKLFDLGFDYYKKQDYAKAVKYFKLAAEQGYAIAQNWLGGFYQEGIGVKRDYTMAAKYYKLAADQDFAQSQNNLGMCYLSGNGVEQDYTIAAKYFKLAADQGSDAAQYNLGTCYNNGEGVKQDYEKAAEYFKLSADQGFAEAQFLLGKCYYNSKGVKQDYEKAAEYFKLAADQDHTEAKEKLQKTKEILNRKADKENPKKLFDLGLDYYKKQDYKKAVEYYKLAADQGFTMAQYSLGECYYDGKGVNQNYVKAFEYFKLAADQGLAIAQLALGVCYQKGKGVKQDFNMAAKYYKLAADQGNTMAQFGIGTFYSNGMGVKQDFNMAFKYLKLAADQGNVEAILLIGAYYECGKGVKQDYNMAAKYYKLADEQGNASAKEMLQKINKNINNKDDKENEKINKGNDKEAEKNLFDIGFDYYEKQNYEKAVEYFKLAADQGDIDAQYYLGNCYFNGEGVKENHVKATEYYKLAAEKGHEKAIKACMLTCEKCKFFNVYRCGKDSLKRLKPNTAACTCFESATCMVCRHFVTKYLKYENVCLKKYKSVSPDKHRCSYFISGGTLELENTCVLCTFYQKKYTTFDGVKYICKRNGSGKKYTSPGDDICDLFIEDWSNI